jgi:hypothetical protein
VIAKSRIWLLPLLIAVAACATNPVTPIVSRPAIIERSANDGLTDENVRLVELARKFLRRGEFELAAAYYEVPPVGWRAGIPSYILWIELAEAKCRDGKTTEAFAILADYDMALKLDYGKEICGGEWNREIQSPPNPNMSMNVFAQHCIPEVTFRVTQEMSDEERRDLEAQYLSLAAESSVLAQRCENISSATEPVTLFAPRPTKVERFHGDGMRDEFARYVEQGRKYLRLGRFDLAEGYFEVASHEFIAEGTKYDIWVELAEARCRNGNTSEGLAILADYDMALDVEYGKESCVDIWDPKYKTPPNPRMSMRVFGELCIAIIALLVEQTLTDEERRDLEASYWELKAESAVLTRSCESISSVK